MSRCSGARRTSRIIDDNRCLVICNVRRDAVSLGDRLSPAIRVHPIRRLAAFPKVDAATGAVLAKEIIFADQPRGVLIIGRGLLEHGLGGLKARALGKLEAYNGCNHARSPAAQPAIRRLSVTIICAK